jgi:hypothetical protein
MRVILCLGHDSLARQTCSPVHTGTASCGLRGLAKGFGAVLATDGECGSPRSPYYVDPVFEF